MLVRSQIAGQKQILWIFGYTEGKNRLILSLGLGGIIQERGVGLKYPFLVGFSPFSAPLVAHCSLVYTLSSSSSWSTWSLVSPPTLPLSSPSSLSWSSSSSLVAHCSLVYTLSPPVGRQPEQKGRCLHFLPGGINFQINHRNQMQRHICTVYPYSLNSCRRRARKFLLYANIHGLPSSQPSWRPALAFSSTLPALPWWLFSLSRGFLRWWH